MVKCKLAEPVSTDRASKFCKLISFGFTNANLPDQEDETDFDTSLMSSDCAKTPSKRNFLEIWKVGRPWLRFDSINKLMTCDICISARVCNTFTTGCNKLKKESIINHEKAAGSFNLLAFCLNLY